MIVPQYWAEGRAQHREKGKQITVRRFGWSNTSQAEAQANADGRVKEALQRMVSGEKLARREPKISYNGAEGVPIREEVISRHGETIITRNSYGAQCLNTPNVLFVDIDFEEGPSGLFTLMVSIPMFLCAIGIGWYERSGAMGLLSVFIAAIACCPLADMIQRKLKRLAGGVEKIAHRRIRRFIARHSAWNFRVYRTPAGLRVLATHQTFAPNDPAVAECFRALGTDQVYVKMCRNQQCFRARVSPKPWRIGIRGHLRPRPGVWPVAPERLPFRTAWVAKYETAAKAFGACAFVEAIGSGVTHPDAKLVQELHDELCRAHSGLPIA